jgi:hypothetical protein
MSDQLDAIVETPTAERAATGFVFTEGPLWHPDGFYTLRVKGPGRPHPWYRLRSS